MKTRMVYAVTLILLFATTQAWAASPPEFQFFIPDQPPMNMAEDVASDADGNLYVLFSSDTNRGFNGLQHRLRCHLPLQPLLGHVEQFAIRKCAGRGDGCAGALESAGLAE